jgi:HAD superfamily hydrolase (TIGR01509 family)
LTRPTDSGQRAVSTLIFDAGGVLIHPNLDWISARLAELDVERDRDALHLDYYRMIAKADRQALDRRGVTLINVETRTWMLRALLGGALSAQELDRVAPAIAELSVEQYPGEGALWYWAMPGRREQLEGLRSAGYQLAVASNNDGSLEGQLETVGLTDLFEVRLDSGVEGVSKPDPELLLRVARALDVAPAACLYVGDLDRVDGAAARGAEMAFALLDPLRQPRATKPTIIGALDEIPGLFPLSRSE